MFLDYLTVVIAVVMTLISIIIVTVFTGSLVILICYKLEQLITKLYHWFYE